MNKKKFKKKWFPYIWNGYHEDVETDLDQLKEDIVNDILRLDQPYPLKDILEVLTKAADILLNEKDYDGDGWENIAKVLLITNAIIDKDYKPPKKRGGCDVC